MANLDTRAKRASSVGMALPPLLQPPAPTGSDSQAKRQQVAFSYSGILASPPGGVTLMTQTRSQFRLVFARIFDRIG